MSNQSWAALLNVPNIADGTALANSVTLTDISPHSIVTNPALMIPAGFLQVGQSLRVTASGRVSNTGTPTLLVGVYYGAVAGTAICTTGAATTVAMLANGTWRLMVEITVRSVGTSGTVLGTGTFTYTTAANTTTTWTIPSSAPAVATIDTFTSAKELSIGAQWGTSSASNTIQLHQILVEALN